MGKYNQPVHAKITRIYDAKIDDYHFLRNDTKIIFGSGKDFLGAVFMSNPGSFEFSGDPAWKFFKDGGGISDIFQSTLGKPDPTMINIIKAVEKAFAEKYNCSPDGYVRIYNLSSIRCPQGGAALEAHNRVKEIMIKQGNDITLLEDPVVYDETQFENICQESIFVIMGFLKEFLTSEAKRLIEWVDKYNNNKKITAYSGANKCPYHPIVWIKLNNGKPFEDIVSSLKKVI